MVTWGVARLDLGVEKYPWFKYDRMVPEHHPPSEFSWVSIILFHDVVPSRLGSKSGWIFCHKCL